MTTVDTTYLLMLQATASQAMDIREREREDLANRIINGVSKLFDGS